MALHRSAVPRCLATRQSPLWLLSANRPQQQESCKEDLAAQGKESAQQALGYLKLPAVGQLGGLPGTQVPRLAAGASSSGRGLGGRGVPNFKAAVHLILGAPLVPPISPLLHLIHLIT